MRNMHPLEPQGIRANVPPSHGPVQPGRALDVFKGRSMKQVSVDRIRAIFDYSAEDGLLRTKIARRGAPAGMVSGFVGPSGYLYVMVDRSVLRAHRVIWAHVHGAWPERFIDHINGVRTDNRICNLRVVDIATNTQNQRRAQSRSKSGLLGVSWSKHQNKWRAFIGVDGKRKALGSFDSDQEAHEAYLQAKRILHAGCAI